MSHFACTCIEIICSLVLLPVQSLTYLASNPIALQHSVKQLAHSPQRPHLVSRSFSGLLYLVERKNKCRIMENISSFKIFTSWLPLKWFKQILVPFGSQKIMEMIAALHRTNMSRMLPSLWLWWVYRLFITILKLIWFFSSLD